MQTLDRLRLDADTMRNIVAWERIPARPARYAAWPAGLDPRLAATQRRRGIETLYTHQALAVEAALRGENVVVVTGTASGKTLAYNLPVLHALLADDQARALYLFPTKALAQDQANELGQFITALAQAEGAPVPLAVRTYDGDTPQAQRSAIRKAGGVLISNPDMLHTGILPHHPRWADLFGNLKYVVLDEVHSYRGVFGSHMANVIRRLRRICAFYGSAPQFICTSATIANPQELAENLTGQPFELIRESGSGEGEKHVFFYNPPVVNKQLGIRRSYVKEAHHIAAAFLRRNVPAIVFANSRLITEILIRYLKTSLPEVPIVGYRGGYLPNERREIEHGLRNGTFRGVVSTNALELGIDIGSLEVSVLAGYPGTIASTWQRIGRAGRR